MEIKHTPTGRGFTCYSFEDRYRVECSLQDSSLASEAAIWFGIDDPKPVVLVPGKGWQPVDLNALVEGELSIKTRMHLTRDQVKALLPYLKHFAKTGFLPKPEELKR